MKKTLTFTVSIRAPRPLVWDTMFDADGYRAWTAPFCEGSYFVGTWEEGTRMQLLAPNGSGMASEVAERRPCEFLSIRHLGEIVSGIEDTTSERVRQWAPAYENFALSDADGHTLVEVGVDTLPEYEAMMLSAYPRALEALKSLCERADQGRGD